MSVDRSVFQALESAVAGMPPADPSAVPVRIHLAGLYLSAGMAELALEHAMAVLVAVPQDTVALSLAAAAASATGKDELADSYRLLSSALLGGKASGVETAAVPDQVPDPLSGLLGTADSPFTPRDLESADRGPARTAAGSTGVGSPAEADLFG